VPAHARNFTCVVRNFIILILLLSGIGLIIMRSDAGAILLIIQIDGQLGREWKLGCFAVAIRDGLLARPIIGKRALIVKIGLSYQPSEFC
jgi:hypothetical protein